MEVRFSVAVEYVCYMLGGPSFVPQDIYKSSSRCRYSLAYRYFQIMVDDSEDSILGSDRVYVREGFWIGCKI